MEFVKIVLLSILSAIVYGILHDQVTARVCVEYFTIGHPRIIDSESPTLLALTWGVIATWWVGLILGVPAAFVSRLGNWPKYSAARLLRPMLVLLLAMGCASLSAGLAGYFTARAGGVWLLEPLASRIPAAKHDLFIADLWAHLAAYGVGILGGLALCGYVIFKRGQLATRIAQEVRT